MIHTKSHCSLTEIRTDKRHATLYVRCAGRGRARTNRSSRWQRSTHTHRSSLCRRRPPQALQAAQVRRPSYTLLRCYNGGCINMLVQHSCWSRVASARARGQALAEAVVERGTEGALRRRWWSAGGRLPSRLLVPHVGGEIRARGSLPDQVLVKGRATGLEACLSRGRVGHTRAATARDW